MALSALIAACGVGASDPPTESSQPTQQPTATALPADPTSTPAPEPTSTPTVEPTATEPAELPKLDQPRITSPGGVFGEPQTITIESNEDGATIVYTLDGTTPSADNGATYTGPFTLSKSATLTAVNTRADALDSDPITDTYRIFGRVVERTGDIVLTGDQEMLIEDTLFLHEGNIELSGNAKMIVRNSFIQHVKDFAFQYEVRARGNSRIELENSAVGSNCTGSFNYALTDQATFEADNVDTGEGNCNVWVFMSGESSVDVDYWNGFGGTVCDASDVVIEHSDTLEVEFCFPEGSTIDTQLPPSVDHFTFGPDPDNGIEFALEMEQAEMDGWGINVLPGSDITIRDAAAITIGVIAGLPWENETVVLGGLERKLYDDQEWQIGPDASLHLVNTNVYGWEPNAFHNNTMVIKNSDYAASAVNSGQGHYDISNSTVDLISATEQVTMTITNTTITGDVIANDDSVITLIDCQVTGVDLGDDGLSGGNVFARGNGKVILQNTTVAGETTEQEDGEIVVE